MSRTQAAACCSVRRSWGCGSAQGGLLMRVRRGSNPAPGRGRRRTRTTTWPMRSGSTKCTLPWTVFLSLTSRAASASARTPRSWRDGPVQPDAYRACRRGQPERSAPVSPPGEPPRSCPNRPLRRAATARISSPPRARGRRCGRSSGCGAGRSRVSSAETTSALMRTDSAMMYSTASGSRRKHRRALHAAA